MGNGKKRLTFCLARPKLWGKGVLAIIPILQIHQKILDFILPPRCVACGDKVLDPGALCSQCFGNLNFITEPNCTCCGLPFEYNVEGENLCAACLQDPPVYAWARAALRYDEVSSHLILALKHGKKLENAPTIARMMKQTLTNHLNSIDLIIPVPLHRSRLFSRRFNQSALLAQHLSEMTEIPYNNVVMKRIKATPPQVGLTRGQRRKNVTGAFQIETPALVQDKNIVLLDDVLTTGATASASTKALLKAGAKSVGVATLARVVKSK